MAYVLFGLGTLFTHAQKLFSHRLEKFVEKQEFFSY